MSDMFDMSQFADDFIEEANEIMEHLDKELLELENKPSNKELLNSIFRSAHTLKGSAAFLNFVYIKELTHKMENLLDKLRNGEMVVTTIIMDTLFDSMDYLKKMLNNIMSGSNDEMDIHEIVAKLGDLGDGKIVERVSKIEVVSEKANVEEVNEDIKEEEEAIKKEEKGIDSTAVTEEKVELAKKSEEKHEHIKKEKEVKTEGEDVQVKGVNSIRVDTRRIDMMMNLVSELVTGRNRLLQIGTQFKSEELNETSGFIGRITTELQSAVMKIRMVPLERVFSRFPRVVRDLSRQLGKEINFIIKGQETELDKIVAEEIYDPLMHMVRNALDHGIETIEQRKVVGKNTVGTVSISARQEENFVYIEISDDGKGIDYKAIERKAIDKGILTPEEAAKMSEYEIINIIFKPGFSMAEKITEVSGRGVGMDVVKNSIEKIGGIVDIVTEKGKGSTFRIRLPLTLAIMQVLIIGVGGKKYAIPLNSVIESIRIDRSEIETISGGEAIFLRGKPLPVVYLNSVFSIDENTKGNQKLNIVVLGFGEKRAGLVIDDMYGKQEIVIKPLGKYLGKVKGITGTAILGDGSIIMILDSGLIVREGRSLNKKKSYEVTEKKNTGDVQKNSDISILFVEDSKSIQKVVKRSLENNGFKVEIADDGLVGLRKVENSRFDLIISDYEMPNMNGFDFVKKAREMRGYKYTPILVMSSKEIEDRKEWVPLNVSSYLPKPYNEELVLNTIKKVIKV